jgi:hypothetical protein
MTDWGALLRARTGHDTTDTIDTTTGGESFVSCVDFVTGAKGKTSQATGADCPCALTSSPLVKAVPGGAPHPWLTAEAALATLAADTELDIADIDQWPASAWRRLHAARLAFWTAPRVDANGSVVRHEKPDNLAYSDILSRWRLKHWPNPPLGICAGCNEPLGSGPSLDLGGYAVHEEREPDCLSLHSKQWRTEGMAALAGFGIKPPHGWEP